MSENQNNESPRETSQAISDGNKDPQHLGKHTVATLTQEVVSLGQTKPMFRDAKWSRRAEHLRNVILENLKEKKSVDREPFLGLENKLHSIINGEV